MDIHKDFLDLPEMENTGDLACDVIEKVKVKRVESNLNKENSDKPLFVKELYRPDECITVHEKILQLKATQKLFDLAEKTIGNKHCTAKWRIDSSSVFSEVLKDIAPYVSYTPDTVCLQYLNEYSGLRFYDSDKCVIVPLGHGKVTLFDDFVLKEFSNTDVVVFEKVEREHKLVFYAPSSPIYYFYFFKDDFS